MGGAGSHRDRRQGRAGKSKKGRFHTEKNSRASKQAEACALKRMSRPACLVNVVGRVCLVAAHICQLGNTSRVHAAG